MKKLILSIAFTACLSFILELKAQVTTNLNNNNSIGVKGFFSRNYAGEINFEIPQKNIDALIKNEKAALAATEESKPFQLAIPVPVDIDISKQVKWNIENDFAFGKFTIKVNGALSASINFDQFYLPEGTTLYVYNENGNMITGPVTEKENNKEGIWGSWVYKGEYLTIEIKTPAATLDKLQLHSGNIAYGYKEIYKVKTGGFGASGSCNINVLCPLGNGWEAERNSVSTILSSTGGEFCSGSLVMNTCGTNRPFYLTANHCFTTSPSGWRFAFQAWSPNCTPSANNAGIMFNGSTLRANSAASDFCLVELNTTPATTSGIHYAGWTRSTTPATSAMGIHHPKGDVMKISQAANPVSMSSYGPGPANHHWKANWTQGVTEKGSSGSPLFDQNHRIIGQLHGGPSFCGGTQLWDFYGRFDLSWTGGGSNSTRLSNWLDPGGTGLTTTNTTNVSGLHPFFSTGFNLMSYDDNLDVGNEPNTQSTNIWTSNDIWNRRNSIGNLNDHQEPGYSSTTVNNIMKLRIKNVGCQSSPSANAKMYWTMASMGEQWQIDWDGTSQLCGIAASGEVTSPNTGQGYTPGSGFNVPALQPNQTFTVEGKWKPKNPLIDYACMQPGMGSEPMICFLGRILLASDPMANEVLGPIGPNVKNNNNIVTRNTKLVNLPGSYSMIKPAGGTVLAHNYLDYPARFNITFRALTPTDVRFNEIGSVTITLSDPLWESWVRGGQVTNGMDISNYQTHEFNVYDLNNAVLGNIEMQPGEYMNIGAGFTINRVVDTREEFSFVFSQEKADGQTDENPYGSDCVFVLVVSDEEAKAADQKTVTSRITQQPAAAKTNTLIAKPNPADDQVTLQFTMEQPGSISVTLSDLNGKQIKALTEKLSYSKGNHNVSFSVKGIQPGTYLVTLNTPGKRQTAKLVIID